MVSDAKIVVTLPYVVKVVKDALKLAKKKIPIISVKMNDELIPEDTISFNELTEDYSVDLSVLKESNLNPNEICFLPFSSGTTGLPKGVELSHKNIMANGEQVNEPLIRCHNDTTGKEVGVVFKTMSVKDFPRWGYNLVLCRIHVNVMKNFRFTSVENK